ncbi:MAG: helicase HerA-like domain-containing protein, partial [Pseudomonadota bacterium]
KAKAKRTSSGRSSRRQSASEAFFKSAMRSAGSRLGRSLIRGVLGSLFKGR